eukprot:TRINITY_DN21851_c1_g5_i1.p2 TRINITY_DN21851_c1_g5~~TRINITY_DN21851_c1_g5_i1.p2  ORF type:complete len:168 (-),score=23.93 TRINITY_DN21851_c1_g5_i1:88-591(-)
MASEDLPSMLRLKRICNHILAACPVKAENVRTHLRIDQSLCGVPVLLEEGRAIVELVPDTRMSADDRGLTHGGFYFGMADYAAMLAVNDPNVVLGSANVRFLRPVVCGDCLVAEAKVSGGGPGDKKRTVDVTVRTRTGSRGKSLQDEIEVFKGSFTCFVLQRHVLDG